MARGGLALQLSERVLDRIDQRPVKLEQVSSGPSGQHDAGHRRSEGAAAFGELGAQRVERDGVAAADVDESGLDRGDGVGVGEDLGGLLERLILVDRHECGRRLAVARHKDVIAAISDIVEQFAQPAAELAHGYVLSHTRRVYAIEYTQADRNVPEAWKTAEKVGLLSWIPAHGAKRLRTVSS